MWSRLIYLWPPSFFGLRPKDRKTIHEQIFSLMHHGHGFIHSDVYNMPVYLRNFYYNLLVDTRKKENEETKKAQNKNNSTSRPAINPRFKR